MVISALFNCSESDTFLTNYSIIEKMGNKQAARELMIANGVPVVPGGKGMRKVFHKEELEQAYYSARQEAMAVFGNDEVYIEKLILNPRHIEFQILADHYGNVIHLGERDCSIQKRNQKLLEESPSVALHEELRQKMGETAVKAAKEAGYNSVGTIEFILDKNHEFYFIEMNTRVQVEHPVTEMVTGIDLIKEQIRSAYGREMTLQQNDISFDGHVIECRINAETSGIVKGKNRLEAIRRMRRALEELIIEGIDTNAGMMHLLLFHKSFVKGDYTTHFWEEHSETLLQWNREAEADDQ